MDKNKVCLVIAMALAAVAAGCSSDEASEPEYGQPAASVGDEVTPTESPAPEPQPQPQAAPEPMTPAEQQPLSAATPSTTVPGDTPAPESLRDAQIVKITDLVNTGEIEQAQLARTKATQPQVKKFAAQMIKEHQAAKQKGMKLTKSASLAPEESPVASQLETKSSQTLETLKSADAASFDAAYMSAQVQQHQEVLDLLTQQLIPSATDETLKAQLEETRTMVEHHLGEAQQISQSLASTD